MSIAEVDPLVQGEYRVRELVRWKTESIAPDGSVHGSFEVVQPPSFEEQAKIAGLEL